MANIIVECLKDHDLPLTDSSIIDDDIGNQHSCLTMPQNSIGYQLKGITQNGHIYRAGNVKIIVRKTAGFYDIGAIQAGQVFPGHGALFVVHQLDEHGDGHVTLGAAPVIHGDDNGRNTNVAFLANFTIVLFAFSGKHRTGCEILGYYHQSQKQKFDINFFHIFNSMDTLAKIDFFLSGNLYQEGHYFVNKAFCIMQCFLPTKICFSTFCNKIDANFFNFI